MIYFDMTWWKSENGYIFESLIPKINGFEV
jgi:hypothetical protein